MTKMYIADRIKELCYLMLEGEWVSLNELSWMTDLTPRAIPCHLRGNFGKSRLMRKIVRNGLRSQTFYKLIRPSEVI